MKDAFLAGNFNLLVASIVIRVVVPARELANLECLPHNFALSLRGEDLLGQRLKVPSVLGLSLESLKHLLDLELVRAQVGTLLATQALGQVVELVRVVLQVEQLGTVRRAGSVLPGSATDHHQGRNGTLACVLGDDGVIAGLAEEVWHHGNAVHGQLRVGLGADKVAHGGQDVERGHVLLNPMGLEPLGVGDEHGHTDRVLKVAHLVPEAALAEHVAVVTAENNDGVLVQLALLECLQKLTYAVIDEAARSVVCSSRLLDLLIGEVLVPQIAHLEQSLAVRVLLLFGNLDLGQLNVDTLVAIPVLLLDSVGIMRVSERNLRIIS